MALAPDTPFSSSRFVGRTAQLEELSCWMEQARDRRARIVVLWGEPGIGKTSLAREADLRGRRFGFCIVWARAWELGGAPPYWVWSEIIEALCALVPGAITDEVREALAPRSLEGSDDLDRQFRIQSQIVHAVRSAARERPIFLVIDDLHALTLESLRTLLLLARTLQDEQLFVLATARSLDTRTTPEQALVLHSILQQAEVLRMTGLSVRELTDFVAVYVDAAHSGVIAERLRERTGGNPFFARELLQASSQAEGPAPQDLRSVVDTRLRALDTATLHVLGAAAVMGVDAPVDRLRFVSGASAQQLQAALAAAETCGIVRRAGVGTISFVHSLFPEVLEAGLPRELSADLHARAAESLIDSAAGAESHLTDIARHYLAVSRVRVEPRASEYVLRAAENAEHMAAYASAADLYERASEIEVVARGVHDVTIALGRTALLAGRRMQARAVFAQAFANARAVSDCDRLALAAIGFARTSAFGVVDDEAIQKLEVAAASPSRKLALRARVLGRLAIALWWSDARGRCETVSAQAVELARESGNASCVVEALAARSYALWTPHSVPLRRAIARELDELTSELNDTSLRFEACRWWLNVAWEAGDGESADAALEAYESAARHVGSPQAAMDVALRRATRAQIRGEFVAAERYVDVLKLEGRRAEDPQVEIYAAYGMLYPLLAAGRLEDVRALLPDLERGAEIWRGFAPAMLPALAYLALGRSDDAARLTDACCDGSSRWGEPHRLAIIGEIALARRDLQRAEDVVARLAPFGDQYLWSGIGHPSGPASLMLAKLDRMLGRTLAARAHSEVAREVALRMGDAPRCAEADSMLEPHAVGLVTPPPLQRIRSSLGNSAGTIAREGALWVIWFRGETARVKSVKGLEYAARLIATAGEEVHVLELVNAGRGVVESAGVGPSVDSQATRAYVQRIKALRDTIEDGAELGPTERVESARAELEALEDELSRSLGLGGRARETGGTTERARLAVVKAMRRARELVARNHPELARHLENTIRTGVFCSYRPEADAHLTVRGDLWK